MPQVPAERILTKDNIDTRKGIRIFTVGKKKDGNRPAPSDIRRSEDSGRRKKKTGSSLEAVRNRVGGAISVSGETCRPERRGVTGNPEEGAPRLRVDGVQAVQSVPDSGGGRTVEKTV